jgi:hypothetical protein
MTSPDALQADSRTMPLLDGRALALAAICACLVALWQFPSPHDGNGDTAWLLIVAGRMLDGARLYVDAIRDQSADVDPALRPRCLVVPAIRWRP